MYTSVEIHTQSHDYLNLTTISMSTGSAATNSELTSSEFTLKGADTPPTHTPTQNDLLVAMLMVYLVLLIVELFRYVDEQSTL